MDLKANTGTVLKWLTYHCPVTTSTQFNLAFIKQKPRQRKALVYYCCASTVFPEVFSCFRFHVDVFILAFKGDSMVLFNGVSTVHSAFIFIYSTLYYFPSCVQLQIGAYDTVDSGSRYTAWGVKVCLFTVTKLFRTGNIDKTSTCMTYLK